MLPYTQPLLPSKSVESRGYQPSVSIAIADGGFGKLHCHSIIYIAKPSFALAHILLPFRLGIATARSGKFRIHQRFSSCSKVNVI